MASDEAEALREAFLQALREQGTSSADVTPQDFDLEVMSRRMKPLSPEERQILWDETAEETCDLIVNLVGGGERLPGDQGHVGDAGHVPLHGGVLQQGLQSTPPHRPGHPPEGARARAYVILIFLLANQNHISYSPIHRRQ